ncbi:MAG: undecaprenyl/decaprenyl-phosphate alpha-N-acetylglucosaminyl 1-phosphate transferase [Candidatus Gastranaerophilales bacterium]|nr:undecaprenyl/decaprenyl-phosphate alpha-N-acetylglucosaminyl 1-phosphate transferase [Candidatus Gastranaerophilales bacterium]
MIKLSQAHVLGTIIAYLLGIFIVPLVIYYSKKKNLIDVPNERKIHHGAISRLGGVAIWISVMLTFVFLVFLSYYPKGQGLSAIIVGGSLMFLMGLIDDVYGLNAKFKLFIQIAIATIVILLGVRIEELYNPISSSCVSLGYLSYPITLLWIVGITNAINFIDGVDGLAGSIVSISALAIGLVSLVLAPSVPITALIAFILMGAMCSFLTFNYNPAKIFMGDSGALYAGFLLATLSITGIVKPSSNYSMYLPILILAVPLMDVAFSSTRRMLKGSSPFVADAEHIHHKLLHAGYSQDKLVLLLASFSMVCALLSIFAVTTKSKFIITALCLIAVLIVLNTVSKLIKKKDSE